MELNNDFDGKVIRSNSQYSIAENEIRWIPEKIIRSDKLNIGQDDEPLHFVSIIYDIKEDDYTLSFKVKRHKDADDEEYEYEIDLDKIQMNGNYKSVVKNDIYTGNILSWDMYYNQNFVFLNGFWNEYSGRLTNKRGTAKSWPENWIWWVKIKRNYHK